VEQVPPDVLLAHPLGTGGSHVDEATVERYAAALDDLPPVIAFRTPEGLLLVDGYHRCVAARRLGRATIAVDVREGTLRDALQLAVSLEASRGGASPAAIRRRILGRAGNPSHG
jgi:hypothetical protein